MSLKNLGLTMRHRLRFAGADAGVAMPVNGKQSNVMALSKQNLMKKSMVWLVAFFIFTSVALKAQSPQKINFQSIVRNTSGVIVSNKFVNFKIIILSGSITGTPVYSETHLKTTDTIGLVSLQIGTGTVSSGVFSSIDWGNTSHFIKLEADFTGGNTYVTLGTQELMSVPYAMYAAKTDTASLNLTNRLAGKAPVNSPTFTGTVGGITKAMVGLENVDNTADLSKPVSSATQTALAAKAPLANPTFTGTVGGITKAMVGLENVDNTADLNKPVSSATQTALNTKLNILDTTAMLEPYLKEPEGPVSGDILFYNNNNKWARIPIGQEGQFLTVIGGLPTWVSVSTAPGPPTGVSAVTGNAQATVSFTAPVNTGGSSITGYTVRSSPGDITAIGASSPLIVTGLLNGTSYTFTVVATNAVGSSAPSVASSAVTPVFFPTVSTTSISSITASGASSGGNISSDGGAPITARGVVWSTSTAPTESLTTKTTDGTGTGTFTSTISGLTASTKYYVRSYATNTSGTSYGSELDFTTCTLNTAAASTNQTLVVNTALTNIMIATMGATGISNAGISGSNGLPAGVSATWANNMITISGTPTASGTFSYSIPLTGGCGSVDATGTIIVNAASLATLTTTAVSVVTDIGASSGGNITADGGAAITAKGVVWSTSILPTVSLSTKTTDGTGTGSFTSTISGLTASTTYYVRAYATNTAGTSYGSELTFTTCTINTAGTPLTNPTVFQNTALSPSITIATTGATGIGTPVNLPAGVTAVWSVDVITISGTPTATGTFTYTIPLTGGCGTVDATGTITVNAATPATLTTTAVSSITATGASSGGDISSDGGAPITARGVVWSTSTAPTISLSTKTTNGTGTGTFTSTISGLTASTTYYVRAYATNTAGTSYGSQLTFTTTCTINTAGPPSTSPTLVVNSGLTPITIATTGATGIGTAMGLPAGVTAAFASNTITISGTPTVSNTYNYSIPLTGGCGTVNATGTMTVIPACPIGKDTIWDIDNNSYNLEGIGTQCWTKENLRVRKYNDGTSILFDKTGGSGGSSSQAWSTLTVGAHTIYAHDSTPTTGNLAIYGYLYNWYAARGVASPNSTTYKNICPSGWHVPTDSEWKTLTTFLGGLTVAGRKMKSTSSRWTTFANTAGNDESGFSALPGGFRRTSADFANVGTQAFFWSNTIVDKPRRGLFHDGNNVKEEMGDWGHTFGFSIRCLKD